MPNHPTQPTQFYGFVRSREHFIWRNPEEVGALASSDAPGIAVLSEAEPSQRAAAVTKSAEVAAPRTEAFADGESQCAPSTTTELARVPRGERAASPAVQGVIEAILAQPPPDQPTPEPQPVKKRKRLKKKRQRPKTVTEEPQLSSLVMHEAHCMICDSDCREEMDELFVNWHNVSEIAREYNTPRRTLYRHAHATGLFPIRDRNLRRSLGLIIHRAETVPCLTADSVIRAVRTLAHINESGEWVNPPTHVIVSSGTAMHANTITKSQPELLDTPCQAIESVKP